MSLRAVFYYLMKNPRCYQKLMKEIDDADRAGQLSTPVEYAESLKLQYLQVLIKEAMRLHPGVGLPLSRVVPKGGAELCETFVPEDTIVGVNAWVVHLDKDVYGEDAADFRPERWLEASPEQLKLMERTFFSVSSAPYERKLLLTIAIVWPRRSHLPWKEHFNFGDEQVCAAGPPQF